MTGNTLQGWLASAVVTLREGVRVLLQNSDAISLVLLVIMISEPVPSPRGTRAAGKGSGALCCSVWVADIIYLG